MPGTKHTYDGRYREFGLSEDLYTGVMRGRTDGTTAMAIQGTRSNFTSPTDLCPSGTFSFLTSPEAMTVVSSSASDSAAGAGARTVFVSGLDGNFLEVSETVTLNGTTPVALSNVYLRINTCRVIQVGSTGSNVGNVTVQTTVGGVEQSHIPAAYGRAMSAAYTVPANYTALLVDILATQTRMAAATDYCLYQVFTQEFGEATISRITLGTSFSSPSVLARPSLPGRIGPKGTIRVRVPGSSATMHAHASLWVLLTPV